MFMLTQLKQFTGVIRSPLSIAEETVSLKLYSICILILCQEYELGRAASFTLEQIEYWQVTHWKLVWMKRGLSVHTHCNPVRAWHVAFIGMSCGWVSKLVNARCERCWDCEWDEAILAAGFLWFVTCCFNHVSNVSPMKQCPQCTVDLLSSTIYPTGLVWIKAAQCKCCSNQYLRGSHVWLSNCVLVAILKESSSNKQT